MFVFMVKLMISIGVVCFVVGVVIFNIVNDLCMLVKRYDDVVMCVSGFFLILVE